MKKKTTTNALHNAECLNCKYSSYNGNKYVLCNYLIITGHRRECEAGVNCTKRVKKEK